MIKKDSDPLNESKLCETIKFSKCSKSITNYNIQGRFVCLFLGNLANFSFLAYGLIHMPKDFASFLLFPFIANLFLYLTYYIVMKVRDFKIFNIIRLDKPRIFFLRPPYS